MISQDQDNKFVFIDKRTEFLLILCHDPPYTHIKKNKEWADKFKERK